jgi:lactate dehydrogenase-like 2-hydroxyacid dehydrogenase
MTEALLAQSDFVSLHAGGAETRALINADTLALSHRPIWSTILGRTADEAAPADALEKTFPGAASDVLIDEPPGKTIPCSSWTTLSACRIAQARPARFGRDGPGDRRQCVALLRGERRCLGLRNG